jgi:hypothetical protein
LQAAVSRNYYFLAASHSASALISSSFNLPLKPGILLPPFKICSEISSFDRLAPIFCRFGPLLPLKSTPWQPVQLCLNNACASSAATDVLSPAGEAPAEDGVAEGSLAVGFAVAAALGFGVADGEAVAAVAAGGEAVLTLADG